jgi:hypothetical protein
MQGRQDVSLFLQPGLYMHPNHKHPELRSFARQPTFRRPLPCSLHVVSGPDGHRFEYDLGSLSRVAFSFLRLADNAFHALSRHHETQDPGTFFKESIPLRALRLLRPSIHRDLSSLRMPRCLNQVEPHEP